MEAWSSGTFLLAAEVPKALCGDEASAGSARRDDLIGPSHL